MKRRIIVAAGPTREKIDPVRFISNYSTGTFGYEIARQARRRGWTVTLISGPTALKTPAGVKIVRVESALEMRSAVLKELPAAECVIMAAAVSDWRAKAAKRKIKRGSGSVALKLIENPDILKEAARGKGDRVLVGFALETENLTDNAIKKLVDKDLDIIVANRTGGGNDAFGNILTDVCIIDRSGNKECFKRKTKKMLAGKILDKVCWAVQHKDGVAR